MNEELSESALDSRIRRTARRVGLVAIKSRWRRSTVDNYSQYQLIEPYTNSIVGCERFNMTPQQVLDYCKAD